MNTKEVLMRRRITGLVTIAPLCAFDTNDERQEDIMSCTFASGNGLLKGMKLLLVLGNYVGTVNAFLQMT